MLTQAVLLGLDLIAIMNAAIRLLYLIWDWRTGIGALLGGLLGFQLVQLRDRLRNQLVPGRVRNTIECAICLDRNKDRVLIPCGHTFCHVCTARLGISIFSSFGAGFGARFLPACPICKRTVSAELVVYI